MKKTTVILMVVVATILAFAGAAFAFAPAVGDVFYDGYDFVSKLSTGAGGATVGVGGAVMAGFFLFKSQVMPAAGCALGAITIAKATTIAGTLGFLF